MLPPYDFRACFPGSVAGAATRGKPPRFHRSFPVTSPIIFILPAVPLTIVQLFSLIPDALHPVRFAPAGITQNPGSAYPDGALSTPADQ